ncbi:MAG TPA: CbiX/SirB N-terminal domain-containing protein [Gemmatimonadaceae bacterium]|nr:CbiX/SirB N-terminal domain-containing protein [Gemmatimonadaceae bacterium]
MPSRLQAVHLRGVALGALLAVTPLGAQDPSAHAGHAMPATTPASAARPATAEHAPSPAPSARRVVGTLVIAHGGSAAWNARVEATARQARTGGPVAVSFLMGAGARTHAFQDGVRALVAQGATEVTVVPLLVSSHSGHYDQIRWLAGELDTLSATMRHHLQMSGITRAGVDVPIRVAPALDDAPEMARVLADRAVALVPDAAARRGRALFLLGHGPNSAEDYAAWMDNLRRVADSVHARTGFRSVLVELVRDDAPPPVRAEAVARARELIALQHQLTGAEVVVVPILVSSGEVSGRKFPADLEGLPVVYAGEPLLPHESMARWVEARVRSTVRRP